MPAREDIQGMHRKTVEYGNYELVPMKCESTINCALPVRQTIDSTDLYQQYQ